MFKELISIIELIQQKQSDGSFIEFEFDDIKLVVKFGFSSFEEGSETILQITSNNNYMNVNRIQDAYSCEEGDFKNNETFSIETDRFIEWFKNEICFYDYKN